MDLKACVRRAPDHLVTVLVNTLKFMTPSNVTFLIGYVTALENADAMRGDDAIYWRSFVSLRGLDGSGELYAGILERARLEPRE